MHERITSELAGMAYGRVCSYVAEPLLSNLTTTKSLMTVTICRFVKKNKAVLLVLLLHLLIGSFYAGANFFKHFTDSVPTNAVGGSDTPLFMWPGDHFSQLYRFSLPIENIRHGRLPYSSGYEYNLGGTDKDFTEGLVFFPFNITHGALSPFLGNIAAYNAIAVASFAMVGGAMYALIYFLTRSYVAALLASLVLALLPHRTAFLFGEMVYGVDLVWPPLIILAFEKYLREAKLRYIAAFSLFVFCYLTSNLQAWYHFLLFSSAYFVVGLYRAARSSEMTRQEKRRSLFVLLICFLPTAAYALWMRGLLKVSGLSDGQNYSEVTLYSPSLENLVAVYSGNEKSIYLGFPLFIIILPFVLYGLRWFSTFRATPRSARDRDIYLSALFVFVVSYMFCFGPNLDKYLHINAFRWYFDNVPGANGSRTPARLMNTAGFYFALVFGLTVFHIEQRARKLFALRSKLITVVAAVLASAIVWGYHYSNPLLVKLDPHNAAYESIRSTPGIVFMVPVQPEASHYFNASGLYYAQNYNLRFFSGHSSLYPKKWDRIIGEFLPLNEGRLDRAMARRLASLGVSHISVHVTPQEPTASKLVLARLKQSPFVSLIKSDGGVHVFALDSNRRGEQGLNLENLLLDMNLSKTEGGKFEFLDDWYSREVYPGQLPFTWMRGKHSTGLIFVGGPPVVQMDFGYKCPLGALKISVNKKKVVTPPTEISEGWRQATVDLMQMPARSYLVEFDVDDVFKSPLDPRDFGCMIRDISVK